jgi:hypothetical protein
MVRVLITFASRGFCVIVLAAGVFLLSACLTGSRQDTAPMDNTLAREKAGYEKLAGELAKRNAAYNKLNKDFKKLENEVATLNLWLLEKDAQIEKLVAGKTGFQTKLDEAIQEVVRTKAKLRSLESRAEAASSMAETEIALKAFKTQRPNLEGDPALVQAQQLLTMSAQEFKKENYGGALYLTNQAKGHISNLQMRPTGRYQDEPMTGEVLFTKPLSLQVVKRSNLRKGPGRWYKVVATLDPDTPLMGYSHKGKWIKVKGEDGVNGWIFQTLVKGR